MELVNSCATCRWSEKNTSLSPHCFNPVCLNIDEVSGTGTNESCGYNRKGRDRYSVCWQGKHWEPIQTVKYMGPVEQQEQIGHTSWNIPLRVLWFALGMVAGAFLMRMLWN